jgi:hypothetical protein
MNAQTIRCQHDLDLYTRLLENRDVAAVNEKISRQEERETGGLRRKLLSRSVRLSRMMAPQVHTMADECIERLGAKLPLELYVFPAPDYNAMCFKPEEGRLFVMFSSSLLESFKGAELKFVIGHELGHHIYGHHDIPVGHILQGDAKPLPDLVLQLFAWSRYAEISADRAGAFCADDFTSVARSLFKLASGLSSGFITFDLEDFLQQVDDMRLEDEMPGISAPKEDWFSTHPFSPLRVKALQLFSESTYLKKGGTTGADLELSIQGLMSMMEPSYIEGKTEEATFMRRLLFAGAIAVANASAGISDAEIAVFEKFFGPGEFSDNLDIARLIEDLPSRTERARENTSMLQRMQVLRDLCLMAKASGKVTPKEKRVLEDIAEQTGVPKSFIGQAIRQKVKPD